MKSSLGIYFGPKIIRLVETKGRKLLNNLQIPRLTGLVDELEERVPEEVKMVALFKEELRRNKVEAKEATVVILGRDLIIRTFDLPLLPRDELYNAVNFEVKKYIPFKTEDLISDFQLQLDRANLKNLILFVGIKKETLERYLSILSQLNIKTASVEYSAFSVLRLFRLAGFRESGVLGLVNVDFLEEDEINFLILENGFPLFSRDITLTQKAPDEPITAEKPEALKILEKLQAELRVSLDFYHRKFPTKDIKKIFFLSPEEHRLELDAFIKERGLSAQFIEVKKYIDKPISFSLSFYKAYSGSLHKTVKIPIKIELLRVKERMKFPKIAGVKLDIGPLLRGLRVLPLTIIVCLLILILPFIYGLSKKLPIQKQIKEITGIRPQVLTSSPDNSYEDLVALDSRYGEKIKTLNNLMKKQLYLTELFDALPRLMPKGVWLEDLTFDKVDDKAELTLQGVAYLADSDKELEMINSFLSNLKESLQFTKYFKNITLISVEQNQKNEVSVTNFVISCRGSY